ncbi:zeta-carotene desaturase, chloroplastic/chromoplastic-like [Rosa rugosa]|uniref:zeta-carotene desaturase, chloroplastic/chromoplastic-like n=1 Tax=Rosa rugosa TaxID=74645 RepID=UPI002B40668D|nr:zeta-carotene desaturase, chloroplastic/chromoplastic-like [Rosa rugosa]
MPNNLWFSFYVHIDLELIISSIEQFLKFIPCLINQSSLFAMIPAHPALERRSTNQSAAQNTSELDFRFPIGAPIHGILAFLSTNQIKTYDKERNALALALSHVVRALVDPDGALSDVRNLDSLRMKISFSDWFMSKGRTRMSIQRMWDLVAYALGFTGLIVWSSFYIIFLYVMFH